MLKELKEGIQGMWWLLVISSIASILFGIATLFMPNITLVLLVTLFAAFLMVEGILELVYGFTTMETDKKWWLYVLIGAALLVVSVYLASHPNINALVFASLIGWTFIIRGIFDIFIGIFLAIRKTFWILSGVISIVAGILVWIYPEAGSLAYVWVVGLYALINGVLVLSGAIVARHNYDKLVKQMK